MLLDVIWQFLFLVTFAVFFLGITYIFWGLPKYEEDKEKLDEIAKRVVQLSIRKKNTLL